MDEILLGTAQKPLNDSIPLQIPTNYSFQPSFFPKPGSVFPGFPEVF